MEVAPLPHEFGAVVNKSLSRDYAAHLLHHPLRKRRVVGSLSKVLNAIALGFPAMEKVIRIWNDLKFSVTRISPVHHIRDQLVVNIISHVVTRAVNC